MEIIIEKFKKYTPKVLKFCFDNWFKLTLIAIFLFFGNKIVEEISKIDADCECNCECNKW